MRLKKHEIKLHRNNLLKKQKGICPLCKTEILEEEATLDHDHGTGHCRRVLHRSCNQVEGRILSWIRRSRVSAGKERMFLQNLVRYWGADFTGEPLHPSHLTDTEQKVQALRKRMRRAKRKRTKQKLKDQIQNLLENQCT